MSEKQLLYAIGWVKDAYLEEMNDSFLEKAPFRPRSRVWLIAAVIAAMLVLAGCAAAVLLGLDNLTIRKELAVDEMTGITFPRTSISLQGFAGSPNFQAAQEWKTFYDAYDPDSKIIQSVSNEEMDQGEEYYSYSCYTPEMARKIDAICEKYGLQKQGMPQHEQPWENVCRILGIDDFLREGENMTVERLGGYIYRSGTFNLESKVTLPGTSEPLFLTIRCVAKTDFDTVYTTIGDISDYTQWTCQTEDGTELLLAVSDYSARIFADKKTFFASVCLDNSSFDWENMQQGAYLTGESWVDQKDWEAIADCFDFSFELAPIGDADWEYLGTHKKEPTPRKPVGYVPDGSYGDRVRYHLENKPNPEQLQYALMDVDGIDGDELLIGRDGVIRHMYMTDGTDTYISPFFRLLKTDRKLKMTDYGTSEMTNEASYIKICQGNKVLYVLEYTNETTIYAIAEPKDGLMEFTVGYEEDAINHTYCRYDDINYTSKTTSISEAEFRAALEECVPMEVELRPISEYPFS